MTAGSTGAGGRRAPPRRAHAVGKAAAGWVFSALWHLLVLAILVMQIHPFQLPETPPVTVELLPPLPPEPAPPPEKPLERIEPSPPKVPPLQVERPTTPVAVTPVIRPLTQQAPPEITPPAPPVPEALRTAHAVASQRIEIERPPTVSAARPAITRPLDANAPAPLVQTPAPTPPAPLPAPTAAAVPPRPVSVAPPSEAAPQRVAPIPVLTNDQTTAGPIEIKPPDRPQDQTRAGPAALPPAGGGAPPGGGAGAGAGGGGGRAGGALGPRTDFSGPIAGFDQKGWRTSLGCLNPETYHLTAAEREACLQRVARETKGGPDLGPNIPPDKKAEYDRKAACHDAYSAQAVPSVADASTGSRLGGLGNVVSLRDCGPADR